MVGAISSNGLVPIVLTIFLIIIHFFIKLKKREEYNDMEHTKRTNLKNIALQSVRSVITTIWTIGTSVTATAVPLMNIKCKTI